MDWFKWIACGALTGAAVDCVYQGSQKGMPANPEQWGAIAVGGVFALLAIAWRPA